MLRSSDKVAELQTKLQDVEEQVIEKDKEMAKAIAEWQEHCMLLEKQNTALSAELEKTTSSITSNADGSVLGNDNVEGRPCVLLCIQHSLCPYLRPHHHVS